MSPNKPVQYSFILKYIINRNCNPCSFFLFLAGYGHLTPVTTYGKLFCIVFCLFGIPLCLLTLKTAGALISKFLTCVITRFERKVLKTKDVLHIEIKCAVLAFTVMLIFLSLCAAMQVILEKWTFVDAFYAWFIAYSTIGFGDYIPFDNIVSRQDEHGVTTAIYHVMGTFPAVFGLGIVASVMNALFVVFDKYRLRSDSFYCGRSRKHGKRKRKETVNFAQVKIGNNRPFRRSHSV